MRAEFERSHVKLVVVVDQEATAHEALAALGEGTDVPLLMGTFDTYRAYRVAGVPANYLIDRNGRLITETAGWAPSLPQRWLKLIGDIEGK